MRQICTLRANRYESFKITTLNSHESSKNIFLSRGRLGAKFICLEWPFNALQELVPKDRIGLFDWLS